MSDPVYNVLFLCTHNSARSILAEAILNRLGEGRFKAYSAGSQPRGTVNPHSLQVLKTLGYDTGFARSKSWDEFAAKDAPKMDFVFTVCDGAAAEACPIWPGQPVTAHWRVPDPSLAEGSPAQKGAAFLDTYRMLERRIGAFVSLPLKSIDALALRKSVKDIGGMA
jgi:protein-tyrosine-phosphatase